MDYFDVPLQLLVEIYDESNSLIRCFRFRGLGEIRTGRNQRDQLKEAGISGDVDSGERKKGSDMKHFVERIGKT